MLISGLLTQTDSLLAARVSDWKFPVSREWIVLTDIYDAFANANFKKPKPYPTPWVNKDTKKLGNSNQNRADVLKRLDKMNPKESNGD